MTAGHTGRVDYPAVVKVKTRDCFSENFMQADDTDSRLLERDGLETLGMWAGSEQQPVNKYLGSGGDDNPYYPPCQRNQGNGSLSNFFKRHCVDRLLHCSLSGIYHQLGRAETMSHRLFKRWAVLLKRLKT